MQFKRKKRIDAPPDITPLIDVVFLLLIFFMLSTTFIVNKGLKITLPKASTEEIKKEKDEVRVDISKDGDIFVAGEKTDLKRLRIIFSGAAATSRESIVIINADVEASHGTVVEVMDSAKEEGITKLAIATAPKGE